MSMEKTSKPERPFDVFRKEWMRKNKIHWRDKKGQLSQLTPQFSEELKKAWDVAKVKPRFLKLARIQKEYKDAVNANVPRREVAFQSRCSPGLIQLTAENSKCVLSEMQLDAIRKMGLFSIINNRCSKIHRSFIYNLCKSFDTRRRVIEVNGDEHVVSVSEVGRILGIPSVGTPVPREFRCAEEKECVMRRYCKLSGEGLLSLIRQHKGDAGILFQQDFLVLVFGCFLFPTTLPVLSPSLLHMVCCAENCASYNWAEAVLNFMCDKILNFKKGVTKSIGGCVHLLLLFYLEHYFPDSATIAEGEIPLLYWTDSHLGEAIKKHMYERNKKSKKSYDRKIKPQVKRMRCNQDQVRSSDEVNVGDEDLDGRDDSSVEGNDDNKQYVTHQEHNVNIDMNIDSMSGTEVQAASTMMEVARGIKVKKEGHNHTSETHVPKVIGHPSKTTVKCSSRQKVTSVTTSLSPIAFTAEEEAVWKFIPRFASSEVYCRIGHCWLPGSVAIELHARRTKVSNLMVDFVSVWLNLVEFNGSGKRHILPTLVGEKIKAELGIPMEVSQETKRDQKYTFRLDDINSAYFKKENIGYALSNCDMVFLPVLLYSHWFCICMNLKAKKIEVLNSVKGYYNYDPHIPRKSEMFNKLVSRLQSVIALIISESSSKSNYKRLVGVDEWEICYPDLPQQCNTFDCGIYVLSFMRCWDGDAVKCTESMQKLLVDMRKQLLLGMLLHESNEEKWKVLTHSKLPAVTRVMNLRQRTLAAKQTCMHGTASVILTQSSAIYIALGQCLFLC